MAASSQEELVSSGQKYFDLHSVHSSEFSDRSPPTSGMPTTRTGEGGIGPTYQGSPGAADGDNNSDKSPGDGEKYPGDGDKSPVDGNKGTPSSSRLVRILRALRLELLAFAFTFSYTLARITSTTMIMDKVCLVHLGYNKSVCDDLKNLTTIKSSVERLATQYQLAHSLIQVAPAALLSIFVGPWSDTYGRKLPMVVAIAGMALDAAGSVGCAYRLETRVEWYFIPAVFTGLFGGPVTILAVIYSYASDCTPDMALRTLKYALIEMALGFAVPFGSAAGGWIFKFLGYPAVFLFSLGGLCLSLVAVVFGLEETRGLESAGEPWQVKLRGLFSCRALAESFDAVAKERPHKGRRQIVLLIVSLSFIVITMNSTGDINYLFAHHQFGWSNTAYSTYTSIYSGVAILFFLVVVPLVKRFRIADAYLGIAGCASLLGKNLGVAVAWTRGLYHIASIFGILGGISAFAGRSRISKVVSNEDQGKVFSFVAASESLLPILTSVLMSQLFTAFLDTFPGMPYLVLSLFLVLPLGVFCWISCLPKMTYEDISHNQKTEEAS